MKYVIGKNSRLKELEQQREEEDKRNEAIDIIDSILPGLNFNSSAASVPTRAPKKHDDFFTVSKIHEVAEGLDLLVVPKTDKNWRRSDHIARQK